MGDTPLVSFGTCGCRCLQAARKSAQIRPAWREDWAGMEMKRHHCWDYGRTGGSSAGPAAWSSWLSSVWRNRALKPRESSIVVNLKILQRKNYVCIVKVLAGTLVLSAPGEEGKDCWEHWLSNSMSSYGFSLDESARRVKMAAFKGIHEQKEDFRCNIFKVYSAGLILSVQFGYTTLEKDYCLFFVKID